MKKLQKDSLGDRMKVYEEVTVSLLEGKVALHNSLKSMSDLYLSPNEKMVLNMSDTGSHR